MEMTSEEFLTKAKEEMFKPKVPVDMAVDLVSRLYGLEVTEIKSMGSFHDQNFHIQVSKVHRNPNIDQLSDEGYTLKIMNTLKSNIEGHFDTVHEAMYHLHVKGLRVPQPIRNLEGKTWQLENMPILSRGDKSDTTLKCGIHLLTYIAGVPVSTIKSTEHNLFEWGSILAKLHNSLEDIECPALKFQPTFLDLKYFSFVGTFLESLDERTLDAETKSLIINILERLPSEMEERVKDLSQGFLHGDFNDNNILLQVTEMNETSYTIDGILDFDEMHYGTYVWDIGMMLGSVLLAEKTIEPLEAAGYAVAGYRSIRHLSKLEMSLLKICMECRVSMMSLVSIVVREDPTNSYIVKMSSLQPKTDMLKLLANTNVDDMLEIWDYISQKYRFDEN